MLKRELAWVAVGQIAATGGGLALIKCQGWLLAPDQLGRLALAMNLAVLVQGLLFAGPAAATTRYVEQACQAGDGPGFRASVLHYLRGRFSWAVGAAVGILTFVLLSGKLTLGLALAGIFLGLLLAFGAMTEGWMLGRRRQRILAVLSLLGQGLRLMAIVGIVVCLVPGDCGVLLGLILAASVMAVVQYRLTRSDVAGNTGTKAPHRDWSADIAAFARPYLGWMLVAWTHQAVERWSLQGQGGDALVGLYGAAAMLTFAPVGLLTAVVTNSTAPILFGRTPQGSGQRRELLLWRNLGFIGLALGALVAVGITPWAAYLLTVAMSSSYAPAAPLLPILLMSAIAFGLAQALATPLLACSAQRINMPKLIAPLLGAGAAVMLMGIPSGLGIAWASLLANGVYVGWILILLHQEAKR